MLAFLAAVVLFAATGSGAGTPPTTGSPDDPNCQNAVAIYINEHSTSAARASAFDYISHHCTYLLTPPPGPGR